MADYDAVIVGSGVNSLACAALLARADWRVCVLERNDWFGGAIKTEELTEPGFLHDVFSAWHPLWVGGAAHAELGEELARARAGVSQHQAADGDGLSGRRCGVPPAHGGGKRGGARAGVAGRAREVLPQRRPRVRRPRHRALVVRRALARREGRAAARPRRARSPSSATPCSRAATGSRRRSPRSARTACSRRGCCTPGSAPTRRRPAS